MQRTASGRHGDELSCSYRTPCGRMWDREVRSKDERRRPRGVSPTGASGWVITEEYADVFRLASPPWPIQRLLLAVLAPLGRLLGYRFYNGTSGRMSPG
jgi:hypothetical protein